MKRPRLKPGPPGSIALSNYFFLAFFLAFFAFFAFFAMTALRVGAGESGLYPHIVNFANHAGLIQALTRSRIA
jgi:hypothetical protein